MPGKIDKFIASLDKKIREKLKERIMALKKSPYSGQDIKKLRGHEHLYRLRVGKIRIIYEVIGTDIGIIDIDYRGNIY